MNSWYQRGLGSRVAPEKQVTGGVGTDAAVGVALTGAALIALLMFARKGHKKPPRVLYMRNSRGLLGSGMLG